MSVSCFTALSGIWPIKPSGFSARGISGTCRRWRIFTTSRRKKCSAAGIFLKKKFADKDITLICDSYFDVLFGENVFDAAVSVESLHHFTKEEKVPLYAKLHRALNDGGYFVLTDYFSLSDEEEQMHRQNLITLKAEQGIADDEFYHYDTPLTVKHEIEALFEAGFSSVEVLKNWGATYTIKAVK